MNPELSTRPRQAESTAEVLRHLVGRVREIDAQTHELTRELREVYAEAKGRGISVKALKAIAREPDAQGEADAVIAYLKLIGAPDSFLGRLKSESLDTILFGTTGFPADGIDMNSISSAVSRISRRRPTCR
jgi:uncharacterized protein (UPF0335 family)